MTVMIKSAQDRAVSETGSRLRGRNLARLKATFLMTAVVMTALSGCGSRPGSRAATGAGLGVVGAVVLGAPLLAGAAVGAAVGVVTTPDHASHSSRHDPE